MLPTNVLYRIQVVQRRVSCRWTSGILPLLENPKCSEYLVFGPAHSKRPTTLPVDIPNAKQARIMRSIWLACRLSVPFRSEGTIVSVVNEDTPAQFAITLDNGPASTTGVIVIIMPLPGKLDEWFPILL